MSNHLIDYIGTIMTKPKNNPFAAFDCIASWTTLDGEQVVEVRTVDHRGFVPALEFANNGAAAMKTLEQFNIGPQAETCAEIIAAVKAIKDFPAGNYIARPGSTPPYFAMNDRSVFHPITVPPAEAIFAASPSHMSQSGELADWLENVAEPLRGNVRPQAILALPIAAVIAELHEGTSNVGFELVGSPATGKSTGLMLAASFMGSAVDRETSYMVSMNATANGLETIVPAFRNILLVLEEGQLFNASDTVKVRATKWRELAHRLADGSSKLRAPSGSLDVPMPTTSTPLWFLLNSNEPLADILGGGNTDADQAVLQRIQTLPANGKYGLYDRIPAGFVGGAAFSDHLQSVMRRFHGTAFRAFMTKFVEMRYLDEDGLRQRIASHIAEFETAVGLDMDDGEASRAAKAFGLIYVAILLGIHLEVLPANWNAMRIARRCHSINRAAVLDRRPFIVRLQKYASRRDLIHLDRNNLPFMSDTELNACPGFVTHAAGQTMLMMSVQAYKRAFPDNKKLKEIARKYMRLDADDQHHPKQLVRQNGTKPRLVTFLL